MSVLSRVAMIPEPTTVATSVAVPIPSAVASTSYSDVSAPRV